METRFAPPPDHLDDLVETQESINNNERQTAIADVAFSLAEENIEEAIRIKQEHNLPDDIWQTPEVQTSIDHNVLRNANVFGTQKLVRLQQGFSIPDSYLKKPEFITQVLEAIKIGMRSVHYDGPSLIRLFKLSQFFKLPTEQFKNALKGGLESAFHFTIESEYEENVRSKLKELKKPPYNLTNEDIYKAVRATLQWLVVVGHIEKAHKVADICGLEKSYFRRAEILSEVKKGVINRAHGGLTALDDYQHYEGILSKEKYSESVKIGIKELLQRNVSGNIEHMALVLSSNPEQFELTREESKKFINEGLIWILNDVRANTSGYRKQDSMIKIFENLNHNGLTPSGGVYQSATALVGHFLTDRFSVGGERAIDLAKVAMIPNKYFNNPEFQEGIAKQMAIMVNQWGGDNYAEKWKDFIKVLKIDQTVIEKAITEPIITSDAGIDRAVQISRELGLGKDTPEFIGFALSIYNFPAIHHFFRSEEGKDYDEDIAVFSKYLPRVYLDILETWDIKTIRKLSEFVREDYNFNRYLLDNKKPKMLLKNFDLEEIRKMGLSYIEANNIKALYNKNPDYLKELSADRAEQLYKDLLKANPDSWGDLNIGPPFKRGAEIFGYEKMFEYINRPGLSRHGALHAFDSIIELYNASGLSPNQFYGQILKQVSLDDQSYTSGTSNQFLNELAKSLNKDFGTALAKAREYPEIEQLQDLTNTFDNPKDIFSSWNNFKRYAELSTFLQQTEILDELKELRLQGKDKLYTYIETLAFHPNSKVEQKEVIKFWRNPAQFLGNSDSHTPAEVHNQKKPSNYIDIPYLDLTAENLRDAVVEGDLDKIQAFTPFEISYNLTKNFDQQKDTRSLASAALGSRKNNIPGKARDVGKLFKELNRVLQLFGMSVPAYLEGKELPEGAEQQVSSILGNPQFGIPEVKDAPITFVAKINHKSDPNGVLAGNDTACCMPFGSGKNNVYTFNPNTALFTLQIKKDDGTSRTIAQSVLTKDKDIKINISEVVSKLQEKGEHLSEVVPEEILNSAPTYLSCDNIEVNPNYKDENYQKYISVIYADFFREYMARYAEKEGLNPDKIPIGLGYTDALTELPREQNTFAPLAPVGYSDKTASEVYMLDLKLPQRSLNRTVNENESIDEVPASIPIDTKGVEYLTFKDTLSVAYLEGKAYADNESLIVNLHNIENALIAKDINNVSKGRPNMSLKYVNEDGRIKGYMLVYEGVNDQLDSESEEDSKENFLYISDLAADSSSRSAGGRLIKGFVELYKKNYLDTGKNIPIFAQARETTSYKIIQKQLGKIAEELGITFDIEEQPTYTSGKDTMHPVIIRPRKV